VVLLAGGKAVALPFESGPDKCQQDDQQAQSVPQRGDPRGLRSRCRPSCISVHKSHPNQPNPQGAGLNTMIALCS
jgi:hypothetical protein